MTAVCCRDAVSHVLLEAEQGAEDITARFVPRRMKPWRRSRRKERCCKRRRRDKGEEGHQECGSAARRWLKFSSDSSHQGERKGRSRGHPQSETKTKTPGGHICIISRGVP